MAQLTDSNWRHMRRTLFRIYPQDALRNWALSLRHFRVVLDHGGMTGGGDRLVVLLKSDYGEGQLERVFRALGAFLPGDHAAQGTKRPAEKRHVAPEVPETFLVQGVEVQSFRSAMGLELWISDRDKPFDVSQRAVDEAKSIEHLFDALADLVIDPPRDDAHCVCPKYYPSLWSEGTWRASRNSPERRSPGRGLRRPQPAFLMAFLGLALLVLGAMAWPPPVDTAPGNPVFAYFHDAGGSLLASGVFALPGLLLLSLAWRIVRIRRPRR